MTLSTIQQVVSFRLAAERYALDILNVQEIIRPLPITPVPLTPNWIAGVINLRGQIVPLIHLAPRLGLGAEPLQASTRFIIVRSQDESIGLVVDQVMEGLLVREREKILPPTFVVEKVLKEMRAFTAAMNGPIDTGLDT